jgi:RNA polymerase sigma-54 factor
MMLEISDEKRHSGSGADAGKEIDNEDCLPVRARKQTSRRVAIDSSWDDVYEYAPESGGNSAENIEFETQRTGSVTLQDHLQWQLELTTFSERDLAIAMAIIDSINEDGYLITSPEEIFQGLRSS